MSDFRSDFNWSSKFIRDMKRIVGEHLVGESPVAEDQERNTDLITLTMFPIRVACRIRRFQYLEKYRNEFTIREGRPSGAKTEMAKLIEGWGDYFLYGFSNADESGLAAWTLFDLRVFRLSIARYMAMNGGSQLGESRMNGNHDSCFRVYTICEFPEDFVIAQQCQQ